MPILSVIRNTDPYNYFTVIVGERLAERMKAAGLNRTALAGRVGVKQPTITRLISGDQYNSTRLHLIARELGTTPAYLTGETDDPDADRPDEPDLTHDERELVDCFQLLDAARRQALLTVAKGMVGPPPGAVVNAPRTPFSPRPAHG